MNSLTAVLQRAFRQPAFVVAVLVLAICAGTLNTAAGFLKIHYKKQAVSLRVNSLKEGIPQTLGSWVSISKDQAIDPEVQQVLATSEYVFRDYIDTRQVPQIEVEKMKAAATMDRDVLLAQLQARKPSAVIRVAVTYYTGLVDTVAHVPERCYVADGFEVKDYEQKQVTLGNYFDGSPRQLQYRFLSFEDQAGLGVRLERVARNVAYVFHCNGQYISSSIDVRRQLQNLFEPYGYYAKVELMTAAPIAMGFHRGVFDANSHDASVTAMEDFLSSALPEIEKCLPDWKAVHEKHASALSTNKPQ